MDESTEINSPWEKEDITDRCIFFRHVPVMHTTKDKARKRRYPNESHFSLRPNEDGLSFNWSQYADQYIGLTALGLTKGQKGEFIDIKNYIEFKIPVPILKQANENVILIHDPIFNGNPSAVGSPNNKSHALLKYDPDDIEIRVHLSHYCNKIDDSQCSVDFGLLNQSIKELQERANDTEYHKLWNFDK